jgi:hypothetical protein
VVWWKSVRVRVALIVSLAIGLIGLAACNTLAPSAGVAPVAQGRLVAVGIPEVGAISAVGSFHPGGPIRDKPEFAAYTVPGAVLDKERLLVASSSNFGAPPARPEQATGSVLSLDPRSTEPLVVPADFAAADGQVAALDGRVRVYTAQSRAFMNQLYNPAAVTADLPAVASPAGISLNNGFGRPWFANTPAGLRGAGTETVIDPDGRPLAGAPSKVAGGVFAADRTNRAPQRVPGGLLAGAIGNALLGKSPDGSGRAVFAVVTADGGIVQVHVEKGIDGLAPSGTIKAMGEPGADPPRATRTGVLFNWVPDRIVYVSDPLASSIVALTLEDDGELFRVKKTARLAPRELNLPIDIAPAVPEVANPAFSSNTTLAGSSDIYVANRGTGTIVRMRQDGTVVASRQVALPGQQPIGAGRLNGIATSPDASRIWVTVSGPVAGHSGEGSIVELAAFGATPGQR